MFYSFSFDNCEISGITLNGGTFNIYGTINNSIVHHVNVLSNAYLNNQSIFGSSGTYKNNYYHYCNLTNSCHCQTGSLRNCIFDHISCQSIGYVYNYENFTNCLFVNCHWNRPTFANYNAQLKNCIFANNTSDQSTIYRTNANGVSNLTEVVLNCVFDVPSSKITNMNNAIANSGVEGKYTLVEDNIFNMPLSAMGFVDPDNGDYRLLPTSPLIAAGTMRSDFTATINTTYMQPAVGYPTTQNKDRSSRPFKDPPSIGPYQFYGNGQKEIPFRMFPLGKE